MASSVERLDNEERSIFVRWASDTARPWLGWGLIGLGLIALLLGWLGVSNEVLVAKQLPYLASGGLLGVGLLTLGSRLLIVDDVRASAERLDRLEAQIADLHAVLLARAATAPATAASGPATLVALPDGTSFHRSDCPMLEGKEAAKRVTQRDVTRRGLVACPMCEPVPATK